MSTQVGTLEDLLRPLAEVKCPCALVPIVTMACIPCLDVFDGEGLSTHEKCRACHGTGLDEHFAALRERCIYLELWCSHCGKQHIDKGDLALDPHKSHLCNYCSRLFVPEEGPRSVGIAPGRSRTETYRLDPSLGAMDACAEAYLGAEYTGLSVGWCQRDDGYETHYYTSDKEYPWAWGSTREESRAKALVATVGTESPS